MRIDRLAMEDWFIEFSFSSEYNLAESGVFDIGLKELLKLCDRNIDTLTSLSFKNGDTYGSTELRKAISATYQSVDQDSVLATTGMSEALFVFFNELLSVDDEVIVVFPTFQPLYQIPKAIGCKVRFLEMNYDDGFKINLKKLTDMVSERTKLVVLNSPHNPSGYFVPPDAIRDVANLCKSNGALLLVDEHYRFLPLGGQETFPSATDVAPGTIVTGSITKSFGLAALRVGWLVAPPEILCRCRNYKDYLTHVLSPISDHLATLALQNYHPFIDRSKSIILKNRSLLAEQIGRNPDHIEWIEPHGGAVCYPRYIAEISSGNLCKKLAEDENVFMLPATCFGQEGHMRISLGADPDNFAEAIPRFMNLLARLGS